MNRASYDLFLALIALGSLAVLLVALAAGLARLLTGSWPRWARSLEQSVRPAAPALALMAAAGSMTGSLIYSEVYYLDPCLLCWVQRGFMYPCAVILAVALLYRPWRRPLNMVALLLAVGGLGVSIWHRYEQATGTSVGVSCSVDNPCSSRFVDEFGFITIPTMAGIGFALIILFVSLQLFSPKPDPSTETATASPRDTAGENHENQRTTT